MGEFGTSRASRTALCAATDCAPGARLEESATCASRELDRTPQGIEVIQVPGQRRKQRGHGEGTVYHRPDGRWEIKVSAGGSRHSIYGRTRAEVFRKLADFNRQRQHGITLPARMTVKQFLEAWVEDTRDGRELRTQERYQGAIRRHLVPRIGGVQLTSLGPAHVQRLQRELLDQGLANPTVHSIIATLRTALSDAVRWGYLARNPVSLVKVVPDTPAQVDPLALDEAFAILAAICGHRHEAAFVLALMLGLREGEVLGLRWQDVDLEDGALHVRGALKRIPKSLRAEGDPKRILGPAKTPKSHRTLPLPGPCIEALRTHRARQDAERPHYADDADRDLVFVTRSGHAVYQNVLNHALHRRIAAANAVRPADERIAQRPFRTLRHGASSLLLALGVPPTVVMEILGHSTPRLTMSVYNRMPSEVMRAAIDRLNAVFEPRPRELSSELSSDAQSAG